uniref:Photosystem II 22 kDa protein n=1 Tax=Rhizophora mucronata TaxID=61149 RepID=A0A2P2JIT8_RHIMU
MQSLSPKPRQLLPRRLLHNRSKRLKMVFLEPLVGLVSLSRMSYSLGVLLCLVLPHPCWARQ